ncbi:unnamed protein product [Strongylus vulgaris]|uniref:Uncharacterized protein n=1 Tax=Strongylus vulgaris TaxID=40348 RepID=A0A3P7LYI3_STRVU|nr:unnamed protein product [Strongylus vulgaris]
MVKKFEEALVAKPTTVPCQRIGQPEDIAEAILFLADRKRSSYIVGHQLVVDGGSSLQMPVIAESPEILGKVLAEFAPKK